MATIPLYPRLFEPGLLGEIPVSNRIVMAPMTRDRAGAHDVPTDAMVEYYQQRASAGLIITEGVQPSAVGKGYWRTPGIYLPEQVQGWRKVAEAVHAQGGKIMMQIMHCGRVVVPENRGFDADIIAPSAIACRHKVPGPDGTPVATAMPRAISEKEIPGLITEFSKAAENAMAAGMDGVEIHCASGYLINQFLNSASNQRADDWGGSIHNRLKFPLAVLKGCADAIGPGRLGFRIAPGNGYNDMDMADVAEIFGPFIQAADGLNLAYLHVIDVGSEELDVKKMIADNWSGKVISNNNLVSKTAHGLLEDGHADAVSFGRAFIANPDLVERMRRDAPLAKVDRDTIYSGDEKGYIDYPAMAQ